MLINQARNLASLPYSSLQQLQSSIQRTQQLLSAGAEHRLQRPADRPGVPDDLWRGNASQSDQPLVANAQPRWQNSVAALPGRPAACRPASSAISTPTAAQMSALVTSSQSATGALAGDAGRQPAPRAAVAAARRSDRCRRRARPRAEASRPRSSAAAAGPGPGSSSAASSTPGTGYQPGNVTMFHQ